MTDFRKHLQSAKHEHLAVDYPGDLASDILTPRRNLRPILWIGPLVAAAMVLIVLWIRPGTTATRGSSEIATSSMNEELLFAVADIPHLQTDLGIAPTETGMESAPSFSDVSAPEMPTMPSFDFSEPIAS